MTEGPRDRRVSSIRMLALLARAVEQASERSGLTLAQYRILSFVNEAPQRAGHLAERAFVSRPALTKVLEGLVQRELVRREPVVGDRRGVTLQVTPAGRTAMCKVEDDLLDLLLGTVGPDEGEAVLEALDLLGNALLGAVRARLAHASPEPQSAQA